MTDKEIIIDGVNVAECEYIHLLSDKYCGMDYTCTCNSGNCRDNPDCYYKQLKRKEQKCEKLKINAKDTYELYKALQESFEILLKENEKLKEEYNTKGE